MVKHSKLFGFITVLGIVFVAVFSTILYWGAASSDELLELYALVPITYLYYLMLFFPIGGTVFLIVGILGIGRQYFKNHRNLFTVLTIVLVPLLIFALIVLMISSIPLQVGF